MELILKNNNNRGDTMNINYNMWTLIAIIIILFCISYYIYLKKTNIGSNKLSIVDFKNFVVHTFIAIALGLTINKIDTRVTTELIKGLNVYYQCIVYIFIGVLFFMLIEVLFHKNSIGRIIVRYSDVFSYVNYSGILTLIAIHKVNIENFSCSVIWGFVFSSCRVYENIVETNGYIVNERSHDPISHKSQLYPQRQTELKHIESYINEYSKNSSCAISICADWGEGKTSFINVMNNGLNDNKDFVIFIQPMIMDSRESLIEYFFSQMEVMMNDNAIYTGKGSSINKYVKSIMEIIGKHSKSTFDGVFEIINKDSKDYRVLKENLQKDIDKLLSINSNKKGKLILLIDDFDRVDENVMYQVLTFIKEIASFKGCIVIFLMDYKNIKSEKINYDYLNKFVSKKFELKKVDRDELIKYYVYNNIYFDEHSMNKEIIKEQYTYFKKNIDIDLDKIEKNIYDYKDIIKEKIELNKEKDELRDTLHEEIKYIEDCIKRYKEFSSNPRRLKRLFEEIEDTCKFLYEKYKNDEIEHIKQYYKLIGCNEIIIKISIIKIFFEEEYDRVLDSLDIEEYINREKIENITNILFENRIKVYPMEIDSKRMKNIYEFINENFINAYKLSKSITEIRTKNEELLNKLDNNMLYEKDKMYGILDILNAIHKPEYDDSIYSKRINKLFSYIIYTIDMGNARWSDIIDSLLEYRNRIIYNNNIKKIEIILKNIILNLVKSEYTYITIESKDKNINSINEFRKNVIFKNSSSISIVLRCAVMDNISKDYDTIYETIKSKENISSINSFAIDILDRPNGMDENSEIMKLKSWVEIALDKFIANDNIDSKYKNALRYIQEDIRGFIRVLELLESIESKICKKEINPTYEIGDMFIYKNIEHLEKEIELLRNSIDKIDEKINLGKMYRYFDQIISIAYKVAKDNHEYMSEECLNNLEYVYNKLNDEYKEEYLEPLLWGYCTLNMMDIIIFAKAKKDA